MPKCSVSEGKGGPGGSGEEGCKLQRDQAVESADRQACTRSSASWKGPIISDKYKLIKKCLSTVADSLMS